MMELSMVLLFIYYLDIDFIYKKNIYVNPNYSLNDSNVENTVNTLNNLNTNITKTMEENKNNILNTSFGK